MPVLSPSRPACPTCGRATPADGGSRPFCSERCRLIDLGAWLTDGARAIPGAEAPTDDALNPEGPGPTAR